MAVKKDLSIDYLGVKCENPFFLSSSPVGGNYDMVAKSFEEGWGGVFYKTIGMEAMDECSPRFDNNVKEGTPWLGFKNMEQISDKSPEENFENMRRLKEKYPEKVMVASIMGGVNPDKVLDEWKELAIMAKQAGADLLEGNFSCPQMTHEGMGSDVGTNLEMLESYSRAASEATDLPFIAKMTPNLTTMEPSAKAAIKGGAKGISAINTIKSITNLDHENMTGMPVVNGKSSVSGYSGAACRPIALRFVANCMQDPVVAKVPFSGIGGIETWHDALDFILLGCRNVQVTTAIMQYGYRIVKDMISGLSHWMDERGFNKIDEFVGAALPNIIPADDVDRDYKLQVKFDDEKCVGCGRCYVSCYDGGHQAIEWDEENRKPSLDKDKCVGCHLCLNVCPVLDCLTPGEIVWKEGRKPHDVAFKHTYE
jgi:dihydropyrimidine dehydrogenase (NAD+) subunit PreA